MSTCREHFERGETLTLVEARDRNEAETVLALLQGAGIPAFMDGRLLEDQFSVARRLMNTQSTTIEVPEGRLEEARQIVDDAREAGLSLVVAAGEEARPRRLSRIFVKGLGRYWWVLVGVGLFLAASVRILNSLAVE